MFYDPFTFIPIYTLENLGIVRARARAAPSWPRETSAWPASCR